MPDGESYTDIKCRIGMAKAVATSMTDAWKSREISLKVKVSLAKACVWSVALYACETWTLKKIARGENGRSF